MTDNVTPSVRKEVFSKRFGIVLQMAISAAAEAKSREYQSKDEVLANSLQSGALERYVSPVELLDNDFKVELAEYLLEYHTDWLAIAREVYEKMDVIDS